MPSVLMACQKLGMPGPPNIFPGSAGFGDMGVQNGKLQRPGCGPVGVCLHAHWSAQAHARLMARPVVGRQDAVVAVSMLEACDSTAELCCTMNSLHSGAPAASDTEYASLEASMLAALASHEQMMSP